MGKPLSLTALGAYRADPAGKSLGGVVVVQEIFGVNHHIRSVCDRLAALGYTAVAPALFDRFARDFECGYSPDEIAKARGFLTNVDWDAMVRDIAAAADVLRPGGKLSVIGFCMGGTMAYLAATRLDGLAASVCFYGGQIVKHADTKPRCPTQMHFGEKDASIPMTDVEIVKQKRAADCDIHVYPDAQHGFYCDERATFHPESASIAWARAIRFLDKAMAK
jgi:carboxymethylenebutenolidase